MPALNGYFPLHFAPHRGDFALHRQFVLRDGTRARMRRAQG